MSGSVRRLGTGVGLTGGAAVAAAAVLGLGTAQAAPADDGAGTAVTTASAAGASTGSDIDGSWLFGDTDTTTGSSVDLLSTAVTNFTDASDLLSGLDDFSSIGDRLDHITQSLTDKIEPAEIAILAHSGSLSGLVDQLFLNPLNQQWLDTSEALLSASQALQNATDASDPLGVLTAALQLNGVVWFQMIPTALWSVPVGDIGFLLGDTAGDAAGAAPDLFDLPF